MTRRWQPFITVQTLYSLELSFIGVEVIDVWLNYSKINDHIRSKVMHSTASSIMLPYTSSSSQKMFVPR